MRLTLTASDDLSETIGLFGPGSTLNDEGLRVMNQHFESAQSAKDYLKGRIPEIVKRYPGYDTVAALAEIETGSLTINGLTAIIEE